MRPFFRHNRSLVRNFSKQVSVGSRGDDREKEKYLEGPAALDGPPWHPVLGDLQVVNKFSTIPTFFIWTGSLTNKHDISAFERKPK
jgi:hypothetical protein